MTTENSLITEASIHAIAEEMKQVAIGAISGKWATEVKEFAVMPLNSSMAALNTGLAHPDGRIEISSVYVGTPFWTALKSTILHELTHCIVGTHHGHNRRFTHIFAGICHVAGVNKAQVTEERIQLKAIIKKHKPFTLELWMTLIDGRRELVGQYYKKSKKYTDFNPAKGRLTHRGVPIASFEYLPISA